MSDSGGELQKRHRSKFRPHSLAFGHLKITPAPNASPDLIGGSQSSASAQSQLSASGSQDQFGRSLAAFSTRPPFHSPAHLDARPARPAGASDRSRAQAP